MRPPRFFRRYLEARYGADQPYDLSSILFHVLKPIYGMPTSGYQWSRTLFPVLIDDLGFTQSTFHPCFFGRPEDDGPPTKGVLVNTPLPRPCS